MFGYLIFSIFAFIKKGNYIIQYILKNGPSHVRERLKHDIKQSFVKLSLNKFASNVTQESLNNADQSYIQSLLVNLMKIYE